MITVFGRNLKKSFFAIKNLTEDQKRIKELESEVASLKGIINDLLERINKLQNRKNSNNSSIPPSKDENRPRKTKGLRIPSGRKPGGQKGHEGSTLEMSPAPDIIVDHRPDKCRACGYMLPTDKVTFRGKRQVIDIPQVVPEYTEHRVYGARCSCGHETVGEFPAGVNSAIGLWGQHPSHHCLHVFAPVPSIKADAGIITGHLWAAH